MIGATATTGNRLESRLRAIALLNLGDWVPRSRSFDVAVRLGISRSRPRTATSKLRDRGTQIETGDSPNRLESRLGRCGDLD